MRKILLFYGIPTLMLGIVISQLFQIPKGLTRWKGGGYGMYSEIHPDFRQVVINDSLIVLDSLAPNKKMRAALKKYAFYPKDKYKQNLIKHSNWPTDNMKIEVWQLFFDSKTQLLNKKIIHQDVYIKD